ncbi:MAG: ATP-binding protein [Candidatus Sericytochromatia bacterium]
MTDTPTIGFVMGTKDATPLEFWVAVAPGNVLRLDDVVQVETQRPDGLGAVKFYGVIDHVRTLHEGAQFDTDTFLAKDGSLPVNISYAAHVQVTRIEPEEYLPPQPGDPVSLAAGDDLAIALHFDQMDTRIPAGVMRNGSPAFFNFSFVNGEKGAHVNISGVSGVATKTSYALYLLHAIFNSEALGAQRANTKALIFNVKGEDLFFLDKANASRAEHEAKGKATYECLNLPAVPFKDVRFCAVSKKGKQVSENLGQRSEGVNVYMWSLRELCRDRLLRFLFVGEDLDRGNLGYLVSNIEEKLARIAEDNDKEDGQAHRKPRAHLDVEPHGPHGRDTLETFEHLIEYLQEKIDSEDQAWMARNAAATGQALIRRLWGIRDDVSHLIRGDLPPDQIAKYRLDPLSADCQLTIADINKLGPKAQFFVVGVTLRKLFLEKERRGAKDPIIFIVLDELNKYAPREGKSPIKDQLVEIAERGRSLGIILIGAQQTASEVERRVVGQAAIRVVGRLDSAEAERPEYNFLPASAKKRVLFLKSGAMFVTQPEVPAPILVNFPFPAYATRLGEVAPDQETVAKFESRVNRF